VRRWSPTARTAAARPHSRPPDSPEGAAPYRAGAASAIRRTAGQSATADADDVGVTIAC